MITSPNHLTRLISSRNVSAGLSYHSPKYLMLYLGDFYPLDLWFQKTTMH